MSRQQQQQHQQQQPALDPRLMPPSAGLTMESPEAQYHRQQHPVPYPIQHPTPSQARVYSEGRPADPSPAQPYFGMQAGRSPSDELPDGITPDRRESGLGTYNHHSPDGDAQDQKRSRACEACRGLKVRCDMDPNTPNEPCKRCKKAGRNCTVTPPSRRRQKKSDTRVAELERKIDALTAVIAQQQNGAYPAPHAAPDQYPMPGDQSAATPQSLAGSSGHGHRESMSRPNMSATTPSQAYHVHVDYPPAESDAQRSNKRRRVEDALADSTSGNSHQKQEVDIKGWEGLRHELHVVFPQRIRMRIQELVKPELMHSIFDHYVAKLIPTMPAVPMPPGTTADDILERKPILLLSILAISCTYVATKELQHTLYDEVLAVLAEALIQKGLKSLEVIQAVQVTCLWQKPPEKPHSANFYMLIHAAAIMSLDLGLGKRFNPAKAKRGFGGPANDLPPGPPQVLVDSDTIEARRTWMVSYFMCACSAQVLRRPNLIRWNNYMNQCVELLETSPDAVPSDRLLAQHIKIQHICEEINQSFALDDPDATSISILDPKVAYTLKILENQLKDWEAQIPADLRKPELMFAAHTTCLYLHEIALHVNHNTDDFRLPFTEASLKSGSENGFAATLTQHQMTSVEACLKASHNAIETFCSFDLNTQVVLPPLLYFVRVVYALIVLIKLHVAVVSPGSELGKIIKPTEVRTEEYLDKVWNVMTALADDQRAGPHHKAKHILGILRDWVGTHQHGDSSTVKAPSKGGEMLAPQQPPQAQQYRQRSSSNDNLRVLSEAATAGANPQQSSANWTFDSPSAVPYPPYAMRGSTDAASVGSSTVMSTPQAYTGNEGYTMFGQHDFAKGDGMDLTVGMDFEQVVNVALQDLDFSGDLFGSFFGNGADAFQIPGDGLSGAGVGGNGGGNGGQGGRW